MKNVKNRRPVGITPHGRIYRDSSSRNDLPIEMAIIALICIVATTIYGIMKHC